MSKIAVATVHNKVSLFVVAVLGELTKKPQHTFQTHEWLERYRVYEILVVILSKFDHNSKKW